MSHEETDSEIPALEPVLAEAVAAGYEKYRHHRPHFSAGQEWWHPQVGPNFTSAIAILIRREAPESGAAGWDYWTREGSGGWIPEDDLIREGHRVADADE